MGPVIYFLTFLADSNYFSINFRDPRPLEVYSVEFVVDNLNLAFAVTDADKNITLFMYQPESRESNGGQKLVRKADFHVGQHINHMFRIRAKITDPSAPGRLLTGIFFPFSFLFFSSYELTIFYVLSL